MSTWSFDAIPDYIKDLDADEKRRRALISMNPPEPLSEEVIANLHKAVPGLADLDAALADPRAPAFDPAKHEFYSWAYMHMRPWVPNAFFIAFASVASFAVLRAIAQRLTARFPLPVIFGTAIAIDAWATPLLALVVPLILLRFALRRTGARSDALRRLLSMFLASASLMLPTAFLASSGAVRAALLSAFFIRAVPIPLSLWLWQDLSEDASRGKLGGAFRAWRWLATLVVCGFGAALRAAVFLSSVEHDFFFFMCEKTVPVRAFLGLRFPVAMSLMRDMGGLQCLVALIYAGALMYGMYIVAVATNFLAMRAHRRTNTPLTRFLMKAGMYEASEPPSRRRFTSTAPEGVGSYRPSSIMLLERVEGLLGRDSAMVMNEQRPVFLNLLDNEATQLAGNNATEWLPPRTEFQVPDGKLSLVDIRRNSLLSWARPLREDQREQPFAQFFEQLGEDQYEYDATADEWKFTDAVNDPNQEHEEFALDTDEEFEKFKEFMERMQKADPENFDKMRTAFM